MTTTVPTLTYDAARELIADGDVVLLRGRTLLARVIRFFSRRPHSHAGMAFWTQDGLLLTEINSGHNHAIPLSQFADQEFDVYERPASAVGDARAAAFAGMRTRIHYGYATLVPIGLLEYCRIFIFVHWRSIMSCAGYVVMLLEMMGMPETTRMLSPGRLGGMLTLKLQVRPRAA